ncbi:hypothetical protein UFOVP190_403 [uncultured Caudovirales phage]|uniref:Uncharacterized protein n=1 Tax=uncultured Caudovirales phage TaxID=2100421 RepID=A0A6J7WPR4_9CAUD|nr:hypothetical protein UFOVP190_403 [uncultured Caudovirales phage]
MDTSFWLQCNPKITVDHTAKKYFGQYLYKLVIYAPAGRLIDSKGSMTDALEHRRTVHKNINHAGWWGHRYQKDLDNADTDLLNKLRDIRHDRSLGLKLRVEEPRVQIYATTEQQLQNLVNAHFAKWKQSIEGFSGPEDADAEAVLNTGAIIRKNDVGYRYKIILKDGRYENDTKQQILNYLLNLGPDEIKMSSTAIQTLSKSSNYIWNLYFYANDTRITNFLELISPGIISNTHELIVMPHK